MSDRRRSKGSWFLDERNRGCWSVSNRNKGCGLLGDRNKGSWLLGERNRGCGSVSNRNGSCWLLCDRNGSCWSLRGSGSTRSAGSSIGTRGAWSSDNLDCLLYSPSGICSRAELVCTDSWCGAAPDEVVKVVLELNGRAGIYKLAC